MQKNTDAHSDPPQNQQNYSVPNTESGQYDPSLQHNQHAWAPWQQKTDYQLQPHHQSAQQQGQVSNQQEQHQRQQQQHSIPQQQYPQQQLHHQQESHQQQIYPSDYVQPDGTSPWFYQEGHVQQGYIHPDHYQQQPMSWAPQGQQGYSGDFVSLTGEGQVQSTVESMDYSDGQQTTYSSIPVGAHARSQQHCRYSLPEIPASNQRSTQSHSQQFNVIPNAKDPDQIYPNVSPNHQQMYRNDQSQAVGRNTQELQHHAGFTQTSGVQANPPVRPNPNLKPEPDASTCHLQRPPGMPSPFQQQNIRQQRLYPDLWSCYHQQDPQSLNQDSTSSQQQGPCSAFSPESKYSVLPSTNNITYGQRSVGDSLPVSRDVTTAQTSGRGPPVTVQSETDGFRLQLLNIGPGTSEDTLENFLGSCAGSVVEGFAWSADRKSAVVTFTTKPDFSSIASTCRQKTVEGHYIEVKTVKMSRCLKVTGLRRDSTEDSVRYYFENKKRGGPVQDVRLFLQKQTGFVWFDHYGVAEKVLRCSPHALLGYSLQVSIQPDLPGFDLLPDDIRSTMTTEQDKVDEMKILIDNLGPKTSADTLRNFLESKADVNVVDIEWGKNKTSAVVTFDAKPDEEVIKKACTERKVDGQRVQARRVNRSKCVKVTGLSPDTTEDSVRYYFENKKRGGPVDDVELYQEVNTALVRFENYGVAEKVCSSVHKLREHILTVTMYTDTSGFVPDGFSGSQGCIPTGNKSSTTPLAAEDNASDITDRLRILLTGMNPKSTEDAIRNFLEAKSDADVLEFEWGRGKTAALVTFESEPDIKALIKGCAERKVEGHKLEVQTVNKSRCVKVTCLSPDTTHDSVHYYFENKKRGGPVDDVEFYQESNTAIVRFENYGVAEKVCSQSHVLRGRALTVQMHMDIPGFMPVGKTETMKTAVDDVMHRTQQDRDDTQRDLVDELKILVTGINPVTSEDAIRNFLEAKADAEIRTIEWGKGKTAAVVTFDEKPDIGKLKTACMSKQVEKRNLKVDLVPKSRSLRVTGVDGTTTKDSIRYYFENKKKSGGGQIEDVQLFSERKTAFVRFEEVGVAERVCSQKHKLAGVDITVGLYRDIPGFLSADSEDDLEETEADCSYECRRPSGTSQPSTGSIHWAHIVKNIPTEILRFLNKSEEERKKFNDDMLKLSARTRFIPQPTGMILEMSCCGRVRPTGDKNSWVKQVDRAVKKSIDNMQLVAEVIDIPEDISSDQMNALLSKTADGFKVRMYQQQQKVHVVGYRCDVTNALSSIQELLLSLESKETVAVDVKAYQMNFLRLSDFLSECYQKHPSVEVHLKYADTKVELTGPANKVREVKLYILEILSSLYSEDYTFKTEMATGILRSSLSDRLEEANVNCIWEEAGSNTIKLYSKGENEIQQAKGIISKVICEEEIRLDKSSAASLKSAEWREKRRDLMEANPGRLMISEDSDVVVIAADNDIFQRIIFEIDKFFEIHTVRQIFLSANAPIVKFLKHFSLAQIRRFQQNLSSEKVTIDFEEGSYSSGIKISGLHDGIAKAKKEVEKLIAHVRCKDLQLALPGINHFFKKGKGKDLLTAIEQNTSTVIQPKDKRRQKKPIKSWTTPAGILSVVRGDICQLKVDAVAFTANADLKLVAGLGKVIAEKGGKTIQEEADKCKRKGQIQAGDVISTGSGHLSCKSVLHAVVPKPEVASHGEKDPLQTALANILKECEKNQLRSVALPALGTGHSYPLPHAVKLIVETLHEQWGTQEGSSIQEIILCDIKPATVSQFVKTCDSVFAGARPRQPTEGDNEDSPEDISDSESDSDSAEGVASDKDSPETVSVVVGELASQKAGALVNPTGKELNLSVGAVSKSLIEYGGSDIQKELKEKYPAGLKIGKIAVTHGGKLNCKKIFHGILQPWNNGRDGSELVLKTMVSKCLKEADSQGFSSIALPALGTGKLGFPADLSASLMFEAASSFLKNNPETPVKSIKFVIHHKDVAVKKAFQGKMPGNCSAEYTRTGSHEFKGGNQDNQGRRDFPETYKKGSVKVDILKGDLTKEKTDCIVSCSDGSFDLKHGALSKAVLAQAGSKLQDECTSKKDELTSTGLAVTKGYNLSCKRVIHLKVQSSPREWGTVLLECLKKADGLGMKSLSVPALGTGGQKMSPEKMASSLLYAVNKYTERHGHSTLSLIRVVIFQGSMVNTYKAVFDGSKPGKGGHTGGRHHNMGEHRSRDYSHRHAKPEDTITLCIYSDSRDSSSRAKSRIQELCKDEFDEKRIGEPWSSKIEKLDEDEVSHLCDIANKRRVVLIPRKSELVLTGRVKEVAEVKEKIISKFNEDTLSKHMKEEAKMIAKLVQWSYVVGDTSKPFTMGLNCRLEKAFNAKEKTIEIKDPKGRTYSVDFKKMTEYPRGGGGKPIKIERFEKAIPAGLSKLVKGEKEALAGTKTVYFDLKPERNFKGNAEDLHFRTAESQFYRLLGTSSSNYRVTKVQYVVNPALIKKFRAAQEVIKKKRGDDKSKPVLAFHGTKEANITSICEGGFKKPGDPGFAAKTDAGYYGSGVYFSEYPEYSMGYIADAKKLLLSQVILGEVYKCPGLMHGSSLQSGYDSHTSPDGKELIIFDTACILPCYIVHYGGSQGDFHYT